MKSARFSHQDRPQYVVAVCHQAPNGPQHLADSRADLAAGINVEAENGTAPEWIELIPAGRFVGRDGRRWVNDRPDDIVAAFAAEGKDVVIDIEHASEYKAPHGDPAPAAGWVTAVENRGGVIWGRVEWTPAGLAAVTSREYRYISPVFHFEKKSGRIVRLLNCGLTNMPNLRLAALNHQQAEDITMWERLLKALGLDKDATEDQAVNAVQALQNDLATAKNRADTPSLDKFVPRADYDAAVTRATNAEKTLADRDKADLDAAVNREIDAALEAGKITPATKEFYEAMCRQEGGLERFKAFVAAAPEIAGTTGLDDKKTPGGDGKALCAEEREVIERMGITEEEYRAAGK